MAERAHIEGADQVARVLRSMPDAISENLLNRALRAGAKEIEEAAKHKAPTSGDPHPLYGSLRDNIRISRVPKREREHPAELRVHNGDAFWGLFLEYGTSARQQKSTGRETGSMPAQPWLRPALAVSKRSALTKIGERLVKSVEKEAAKLAGKFGALGKARTRRLGR
jgi:HK97 gp10 family phage protein